MKHFFWGSAALLLYAGTFVAIYMFFSTPSWLTALLALVVWLVTLVALRKAG
jgi:hypothetical protein